MSYWKRMRLYHGITQKDMAERIGVSCSVLSLYENGKKKMPTKYWIYYLALNEVENYEVIKLLKEMGY